MTSGFRRQAYSSTYYPGGSSWQSAQFATSITQSEEDQTEGELMIAQGMQNEISKIYILLHMECNKVGCDGTSVSTGFKGGIIRNMELILNRSLQWLVCQLHANELPLRHPFAHVDRTTTEPRSLTIEIRKSLAGCEKQSVASSTPIEYTPCEVTNKKVLSTDQMY
ncbi:hypothetical protein AVEN_208327-1 [Araneus ventricosus]|uniref:Uncharacterized protein n=1 Tax=Araneus ventricosus TaxID=182803 RepID=A0A4Y2TF82_ARAVE|nr:hypothetical protein AVEN_208327-1 [Araneus ventricosus]